MVFHNIFPNLRNISEETLWICNFLSDDKRDVYISYKKISTFIIHVSAWYLPSVICSRMSNDILAHWRMFLPHMLLGSYGKVYPGGTNPYGYYSVSIWQIIMGSNNLPWDSPQYAICHNYSLFLSFCQLPSMTCSLWGDACSQYRTHFHDSYSHFPGCVTLNRYPTSSMQHAVFHLNILHYANITYPSAFMKYLSKGIWWKCCDWFALNFP